MASESSISSPESIEDEGEVDAPTPIISNREVQAMPPPLSLPPVPYIARYSPPGETIVMKHPAKKKRPAVVPGVASAAQLGAVFVKSMLRRRKTRIPRPLFSPATVRGIPNYGQTCFLNAVLQSLAALDVFAIYLKGYEGETSRTLLQILESVNGSDQKRIDTRSLLRKVGEHNVELAVTGEQQDAEELLQAVLGITTEEESEWRMRAMLSLSPEKDDGTVVTCVQRPKTFPSIPTEIKTPPPPPPPMKRPLQSKQSPPGSPSSILHHPEEKKEESFELYIPRVNSEDNMSAPTLPLERVQSMAFGNATDDMSDVSCKTESPVPSSPFCFWTASPLRCQECKHIRPIQNDPLLVLPVVPTAVSQRSPATTCTLVECLRGFCATELVHDVECRSCTLARETKDAQDDLELYEGALQSTKNVDHWQNEYDKAAERLEVLRKVDMDDDESFAQVADNSILVDGLSIHRAQSLKCLLLTRLPTVLTIHVQRRYFDPVQDRMTKTTQHVNFPLQLDVRPFCEAVGPNFAFEERYRRQPQFPPLLYQLVSVIEHRGNAFAGHYVCYRRDANGDWFFVSDNQVRRVEWADVRKASAYMLFYESLALPVT